MSLMSSSVDGPHIPRIATRTGASRRVAERLTRHVGQLGPTDLETRGQQPSPEITIARVMEQL